MTPSFIYHFIESYLKESGEYKEKTTKKGRKFFFRPLRPLPNVSLQINGKSHVPIEQHFSIYATYKDNKPGFEAYHLTTRLRGEDGDVIFRCYFNQYGTVRGVTLRCLDKSYIVAREEVVLCDYGRSIGFEIIQKLNKLIEDKEKELRIRITAKEREIEELSKDLKNNLKQYVGKTEELIQILKEYNLVTNDGLLGKKNILEDNVRKFRMKLSQKRPEMKVASKRSAIPETKEPLVEEEKPSEVLVVERKPEMKICLLDIERKLSELKEKNDIKSLQEKRKLVNEKLNLLSIDDLDDIVIVFKELNNLEEKIKKECMRRVMEEGDLEAARLIIENHYYFFPGHLFALAYQGFKAVFELLFPYSSAGISLNAQIVVPGYDGLKSLLDFAYEGNQMSLFQLLLALGADPNLLNDKGTRLIHRIIMSSESYSMEYLKALVTSSRIVDINVRAVKDPAYKYTHYTISSTNKVKTSEIKKIQQDHHKGAHEFDMSALMLAIYYQKNEIVDFLLKHKADPTIRDSKGFNALTFIPALEKAPLHLGIMLSLMKAGLSIDQVNTLSSHEQVNSLYYRCQWVDKEAVILLVNQCAANPNILLRYPINTEKTKWIVISPFIKAVSKATSPQGADIVRFLLNQDITPLIMANLESAMRFLPPSEAMIIGGQRIDGFNDDEKRIEQKKYHEYVGVMEAQTRELLKPLGQAIYFNIIKLTLVKAAEAALESKHYHDCLEACDAINTAEFKMDQYNERVCRARSHAFIGLENYKMAHEALKHYLSLLNQKFAQVPSPNFRKEVRKKIKEAQKLLRETQRKLRSTVTVPVTFFADRESKEPIVFSPAQLEMPVSSSAIIRRKRDDSRKFGGHFGYRHK